MRNRDAFREYVTGSLWVLPGINAVLALVAGFILSRIPIDPGSPLAFRGTADDARTLLSNVTSTVVTVIALVLGLTVVALQLSSTQFSPRLLRSFLRDRPTQVVLSTFVATFAYSAAGLYTVGLSAGGRPRNFRDWRSAVLAWMWTSARDEPAPDPVIFQRAMMDAVQVGFERTQKQDDALGIRQLVDIACKALSPAVNDPYTAVQAIDHLSVIFCALAVRPLGDDVAADPTGRGVVIVPGRRFGDYLATMCGLLRRYGCADPTVALALLGLLHRCATVLADDPARWAAVSEQADLVLADATRATAQSADLTPVVSAAADLRRRVALHVAERFRVSDQVIPPS